MDDVEIRALVTRLSRPHPSGGNVVERAAILAEGGDFATIVDWIAAHSGQPEAAAAPARRGGLHGTRPVAGNAGRPPQRYILPAGALD